VLEGKTTVQAAIGWLLGKPEIASIILGARTRAQLEESLGSSPLGERTQSFLDKAVKVLEKA